MKSWETRNRSWWNSVTNVDMSWKKSRPWQTYFVCHSDNEQSKEKVNDDDVDTRIPNSSKCDERTACSSFALEICPTAYQFWNIDASNIFHFDSRATKRINHTIQLYPQAKNEVKNRRLKPKYIASVGELLKKRGFWN